MIQTGQGDPLASWLQRMDAAQLECDGMSRCFSTILSQNKVQHTVHEGIIRVDGVGSMSPHWWITLDADGRYIDLRARMWLGDLDQVPHGIFHPSQSVHYESLHPIPPELVQLPSFVFQILSGQCLESFKISGACN